MSRRTDKREEMRRELEAQTARLFHGGDPSLLSALVARFPEIDAAYIVDHIPEQDEDIYTVVVGVDRVATVEVDRFGVAPSEVDVLSIREYRKQHPHPGKKQRRMMEVAIELFKERAQGGCDS